MPLSVLTTGSIPAIFWADFFPPSEVACHYHLPRPDKKWLAQSHPIGFVCKVGLACCLDKLNIFSYLHMLS